VARSRLVAAGDHDVLTGLEVGHLVVAGRVGDGGGNEGAGGVADDDGRAGQAPAAVAGDRAVQLASPVR
jgi:hypothetical protein